MWNNLAEDILTEFVLAADWSHQPASIDDDDPPVFETDGLD